MPDFLHETSETAAPSAAPVNGVGGPSPSEPLKAEASVKAPAPAAKPRQASAGEDGRTHRGDMHGSRRKSAPLIFTHYYGAFFLLIVALFLGAGYLLLVPSYSAMNDILAQTSADADALQKEQAYLTALNNSISAAEAIPKDVLMGVNEAIPNDSSGIPKLLVTMSAIAKQSGVDLGSVQFSPGSASEVSGSAPIALSLVPTGISTSMHAKGYQEMRRYLTNLEESLRLIDVNSISVSGGGESAEAGQGGGGFSYTLSMTTYSVAQAPRNVAPANPAAAPAGQASVSLP